MLTIAVTHPDVISRNPRSLSDGGRHQALLAARRLRELLGKRVSLAAVLSSPRARCLETGILVAREFGETTVEDGAYEGRIEVVQELDEVRGAPPKAPSDLAAALASHTAADYGANRAVLLAVHGDLANMLRGSWQLTDEVASGGWFDVRPVIAGFEHASGQVQSVQFCEALRGGSWVSCVMTE
jgi:hypothetical protein